MADAFLTQIGAHLKGYGYRIEDEKDSLTAYGDRISLPTLTVSRAGPGAIITIRFTVGEEASDDKPGFLSFLNGANRTAIVARFYEGDRGMIIEAWYPLEDVDEQRFRAFFNQLIEDINAPKRNEELVAKYFHSKSTISS